MRLKTLLGDYPVTRALRDGRVRSDLVQLDIADVKVPHTAFKRVVRDLEFDVAEIAIVTFLMAKAYGKPLRLLPAVMFGRFQHPYLVSISSINQKNWKENGWQSDQAPSRQSPGSAACSPTTTAWICAR